MHGTHGELLLLYELLLLIGGVAAYADDFDLCPLEEVLLCTRVPEPPQSAARPRCTARAAKRRTCERIAELACLLGAAVRACVRACAVSVSVGTVHGSAASAGSGRQVSHVPDLG